MWTSSAPLIATTDANGRVSGVVPGTAVLTATETESGKSASITVTVRAFATAGAYYFRTVTTNDIIVDPVTSTVYGSIPGIVTVGSIRTINPYSTSNPTGPPVFVGSEPGKLGISDDGRYVYIGFDNAPKIVRYNSVTRTTDGEFPLGSAAAGFFAEDIEVVPGSPDSVAVSRRTSSGSPRGAGVFIYDNGVPRPRGAGGNVITFGASPSRLYGYNSE
ncbi:MAG: Ig-like domain-containing protein, partial [Armatimonadota bacterium]